MIKRVHYVQLSLLMLLLLILFQITSISITFHDFRIDPGSSMAGTGFDGDKYSISSENIDILVVTGEKNDAANCIEKELTYLKRGFRSQKSLLQLKDDQVKNIKVIILAADKIKGAYTLELVQKYMQMGINVIMAVLPAEELDNAWKSFLGIKKMGDFFTQEGITVFPGFFLGGKHEYKDLKLDMYAIKLGSTCKTYIAGMTEEKNPQENGYQSIKDILWRNIYEGSQIYVVNGNLLIGSRGIGIISSIFAQMYQEFIYPVINARAVLINGMPSMSMENAVEMQNRYARNTRRFYEDIALPDIIAVCLSTSNIPTFYSIGSLDDSATKGNKYDASALAVVKDELDKIGGEIGISAFDLRSNRNEAKVTEAADLFKKELGSYHFQSLIFKNYDKNYRDSLVNAVNSKIGLSSLVSDGDEGIPFSLYNDRIINIPSISEGFISNSEELFKLDSAVTALGVITHEIDMSNIIYPEDKDDDWSRAFSEFTTMINTYWRSYKTLDSLNISNVNRRVYEFLSVRPDITVNESKISMTVKGSDKEAYFILRTSKDIAEIQNGTYKKLEDGAYLICTSGDKLDIRLK